jgi:hypothetical protein
MSFEPLGILLDIFPVDNLKNAVRVSDASKVGFYFKDKSASLLLNQIKSYAVLKDSI